jgi:hypothetical protein
MSLNLPMMNPGCQRRTQQQTVAVYPEVTRFTRFSGSTDHLAQPRAVATSGQKEKFGKDETIAEVDTLLLTVLNQLDVACNTDVIEATATHVDPAGAAPTKRLEGSLN